MNYKRDILPILQGDKEYIFGKQDALDEVYGGIEITTESYKLPWAIFRNLTFKGHVVFKEVDLHAGIGFENCTFHEDVTFYNVSFTGSEEEYSLFQDYNIFFNSCKFEKGIYLGASYNIQKSIEFKNCIIKECIAFKYMHISSGLRLHACHINQSLFLENCKIEDPVVLDQIKCEGSVAIDISNGKYLNLNGGEYRGPFTINYENKNKEIQTGFESLNIDSCEFTKGLFVKGLEYIDLRSESAILESIHIKVSNKMQGDISFSDINVNHLCLSGNNSGGVIKLDKISVNELVIHDFYNYAQALFSFITALKRQDKKVKSE